MARLCSMVRTGITLHTKKDTARLTGDMIASQLAGRGIIKALIQPKVSPLGCPRPG
jgi:hypothetical protein